MTLSITSSSVCFCISFTFDSFHTYSFTADVHYYYRKVVSFYLLQMALFATYISC